MSVAENSLCGQVDPTFPTFVLLPVGKQFCFAPSAPKLSTFNERY